MNYLSVEPVENYREFDKNMALDFKDDGFKLVNTDTIIFDEEDEILCIVVKYVIKDDDILDRCYEKFEKCMKHKLDNRGASAGMVKWESLRLDRGIAKLCPIKGRGYRARYVKKNGEVCKRTICNAVASCVVGYVDTTDTQNYKYLKNCKRKQKEEFLVRVRKCAYSRKIKGWGVIYPLVHKVETLFKECLPYEFQRQRNIANNISNYTIDNSVYSTVTINNNFKTFLHTDANNFDEGYGAMLVDERKGVKEYGFNLLFPRYHLTIDLTKGDLIFFKSREYHCNTQFKADDTYERISYVFYLRKKLLKVLDIKNATIIQMNNNKTSKLLSICKKVININDTTTDTNNYYFSYNLISQDEKDRLFSLPKKSQIIIDCPFSFTKKDIKKIEYRGYRINFLDTELQKQYYIENSKLSHYCLYYD